MPRRNFAIIAVMLIVALVCFHKVQRNRYGRIFAETMTLVERNSLEEVPSKQLFEGAMDGMMSRLDEYSAYMSPDVQNEMNELLDSKFGGIGVEISLDPKVRQLTVISPYYDSPAYKAGVRAGDQVLKIDNQSTQGMSLKDASELLRGQPGEKVTLTVLHRGEEKPCDLEIVRSVIHVATVLGDTHKSDGSWNLLLPGTKSIGYLRITGFSTDTGDEMERAVQALADQGMTGLVIDLRDNPGGLLAAACSVCDLFLKKGTIVTTRGRDGSIREEYVASGKGRFTDVPLVVLVNRSSASASEIVAACLQDYRRATIVGQRTFGKGTIQQLIDLEKDCGALRLTTASYWRPSEKNIHRKRDASETDQWGVKPDSGYEVALSDEETTQWRLWRVRRDAIRPTDSEATPPTDFRTSDRALEKAVEVLEKTPSR